MTVIKNTHIQVKTSSRLWLAFGYLVGCFTYASDVYAKDVVSYLLPKLDSSLSQTFSMDGGLIYDSNPLLSTNAQAVWLARLQPRYALQHNSEQGAQFIDVSVILQESSNTAVSVNRQDPKLTIGFNHLFNNGSFSTSVGYAKRSVVQTQINDTGLVDNDGTVINKNINSTLSYLFSARLNASMGLAIATSSFEGAGQALRDFDSYSLTNGMNYAFNDVFTGKISFGYTQIKRALGDSDLINLMVGGNWTPSRNLDINMLIGANQSKLDNAPIATGFAADLGASYTADFNRVNASFNRSVRPTGLSLLESDRINVAWNHTYNDTIKFGLSHQFLKTRNQVAVETQVTNVFLNKQLNREWSVGSYIKKRQIQRLNGDGDGITVGLTFKYGYNDYQDEY